jgi:hypothetical protein
MFKENSRMEQISKADIVPMQVLIYYYRQLAVPRGDIEAELEALLEGRGEVSGGGGGIGGGNIDLEIESDDPVQVLEEIRQLLRKLSLPTNTVLDVEGRRLWLYEDSI